MAERPVRASGGNTRVALICALVFFGMVGAAFAAVPLYRKFCQATGWNGAVREGQTASAGTAVSDKTVAVRFDTNVRGLTWSFQPDQASQTTHLGEHKLAFFRATNTGSVPLTGRASYNVLPETAGPYFSKLECFCFKSQTIQPGQTIEFPVVYVVDPRFAQDKDNVGRQEITLSYTFFPAPLQETASAGFVAPDRPAAAAGANGRASNTPGKAPQPLEGPARAGL
jgi:cytochrome c oxidase assembly protein subunit 11